MGRSDGTLVFDTKIITDGFNKGMSAIKTAAKGIGVITAGFTAATGAALKFAGELEQNLGGSEAVFKEFASTVQKTADTAFKNMGLSTSDFLATANKMGALFQGSGFKIQESAELSAEVMQRAADVASIMGIDVSMAMESIAGAAKGNFTMMDNLGVAMNDTTLAAYALEKGITKSTRAMTNQEKIALAMEMFLERTEYAAGNYAKENETLAGALNTASAALKNFMSGTGEADDLAESLSNAGKVIVENIGELTPMLAEGIGDIFSELAPLVPEMLDELTEGVMSAIEELADGISGNSDKMADAVIKLGETLVSGIIRITPKLADAAKKIISSFADELGNTYPILKPFTAAVKLLADNMELCIVSFAAFKGLTTIVSVIRAIMASFQTAALQVGLYTLSNKGAALSASALSAALTVKEIIVGALTGKIHLLTAAQALLNKVWMANPVGVVVGGVVALIAALTMLHNALASNKTAWEEEKAELLSQREEIAKTKEEWQKLKDAEAEAISSSESQMSHIQSLANELRNLADVNGEVADGDKGRAQFILNELNNALGTEYTLTGNVISQYGKLCNEIDNLIAKKRAEAILSTKENSYKKALEDIGEQRKQVAETGKLYNDAIAQYESYAERRRVLNEKIKEAEANQEDQTKIFAMREECASLGYEMENLNIKIGEYKTNLKAATEVMTDTKSVIDDYEDTYENILTGNYDAVYGNSYNSAKGVSDGTIDSLNDSKSDIGNEAKKTGEAISDSLADGVSITIPKTADALKDFANNLRANLNPAIQSASVVGEDLMLRLIDGTTLKIADAVKVSEDGAKRIIDGMKVADEVTKKLGSDYIDGIAIGVQSREEHLKIVMTTVMKNAHKAAKGAVRSNSPAKDGIDLGTDYVKGLEIGAKKESNELNIIMSDVADGMSETVENSITSNLDGIRSAISAITGVIKEESEQKLKVYEAEHKKIEILHDFGIDDEETYYKKLEYLRDNYLTKNSDKWIEVTQDLYDYQEGQLEEHRDKVEEIYDDIADYVTDKLEDVSKKQQKFTEKLNDSTPLYQKVKITAGDETTEFYRLNDFGASNKAASEYGELLEKITSRIKASDVSDEAKNGIISELESLGSSEDGIGYIKAMLGAKDDEFASYLTGYQNMLATNAKTSADMYYDDAVNAANEGYQYMIDEFTKAGFEIPEGFLVSGALSAENFGRAFMEELDLQMQEIQKKLSDFNARISASVGTGGNVNNDNRSTTYHIYGNNSTDTVKEIENYETVKRLSGQ